ncbi:YihY family inner membrane protein [Neisseriaceae bacterium TC5R-5]|nr:YihY family inner membrane protein [Neisseriaceae bacterium TC5R-5]
MNQLQSYLSFTRFLLQRMGAHRVREVASSLTFTTLLALVPLLTITLTVISAFPVFADLNLRFKTMLLSTLVPEFAGKVVFVYMQQFADNAGKLTAAGIAALGITALLLMSIIERAFNTIWGVQSSRPWLQQSMVYWTVLTLGPLALGGGLLAWRRLFQLPVFHYAPSLLSNLLETGGTIILTGLVLSLLYRVLPNRFVPFKHALSGAVLASILLEATRALFGLYIAQLGNYQLVYGAFASVPIFLLWLYCLWLVILVGAVFTASLSYWEGNAWRRRCEPQRRFLDALEVMLLLDAAQEKGVLLSPRQLREQIKVGYDELGLVLDALSECGYVHKGQGDHWALGKKLSQIKLIELFELFVYRADPYQVDEISLGVAELLGSLTSSLASSSLQDFARLVGRK